MIPRIAAWRAPATSSSTTCTSTTHPPTPLTPLPLLPLQLKALARVAPTLEVPDDSMKKTYKEAFGDAAFAETGGPVTLH